MRGRPFGDADERRVDARYPHAPTTVTVGRGRGRRRSETLRARWSRAGVTARPGRPVPAVDAGVLAEAHREQEARTRAYERLDAGAEYAAITQGAPV
ncbi:hypothetical protein [Yinghuangia seranimata]|uniref:hypothetical protein n=1 Tax=Yinghuangia seranimata TaxID=408067 RepID=UPI00248AD2A7|nr:hypothetical protein [Yinghuangia seranimata]MDI2128300.1 hypothetical protein [Yinghuangia seranimata]